MASMLYILSFYKLGFYEICLSMTDGKNLWCPDGKTTEFVWQAIAYIPQVIMELTFIPNK